MYNKVEGGAAAVFSVDRFKIDRLPSVRLLGCFEERERWGAGIVDNNSIYFLKEIVPVVTK